jgi:hypothetical protein
MRQRLYSTSGEPRASLGHPAVCPGSMDPGACGIGMLSFFNFGSIDWFKILYNKLDYLCILRRRHVIIA